MRKRIRRTEQPTIEKQEIKSDCLPSLRLKVTAAMGHTDESEQICPLASGSDAQICITATSLIRELWPYLPEQGSDPPRGGPPRADSLSLTQKWPWMSPLVWPVGW